MTADDFDFDQALDRLLDTPLESRDQVLSLYEQTHPEHAKRLKRLLAFAMADTSLPTSVDALAPALINTMFDAADMERIGTRVGAYKVTSLVSRGGMGVVFRAERDDGVYAQTVAIKFLPRLMATERRRELFLNERANLARLEHPNIARIIDAGVTDDQLPYFVMEYVEGESLDIACDALSFDERLTMFTKVCDAVSYCHQSLIVHGDIKPSNILVAEGRVRLLDFGVGHWLMDDQGASQWHSGFTKAFAAPEVREGGMHTIASDIFSLGMVLLEILGRSTNVPLADDLDHIAQRCLQAAPDDRYASVAALKQDLEAFVEGYPIRSRRNERGYVAQRFLRRNKLSAIALATTLLGLVVGLMLALWQYDVAKQEAIRAAETADFVKRLFERAGEERDSVDEITLRALMDAAVLRLDDELARSPSVKHDVMALIASGYTSLGDYEASRQLHESVLAYHLETSESPSADIAVALAAVANDMVAVGEYEQGLTRYADALGQLEASGNSDSLAMADVLGRYSLALYTHSRSETDAQQAKALLERKGKILERVAPGDFYLAYIHLANVASWHDAHAEYQEAASLKEQAIAIAESHGYGYYPSAITIRCNLGYSYDGLGQWAKAVEAYRSCIDRRTVRLGDQHPGLISAYQNLAVTYLSMRQFREAKALLKTAAAKATDQLPENSVTRLAVELNLARVLIRSGESAEALVALPSIMARMSATLGERHPAAARVRSILGKAHWEVGDYDAGLVSLRRAYADLEDSAIWAFEGNVWVSDVTVWRADAELSAGDVVVGRELASRGLEYRQRERNVPGWRINEAEEVLRRASLDE